MSSKIRGKRWLACAAILFGAVTAGHASANTVDVIAKITGVKYATSSYTTVGVTFNGSNLGSVIAGPEMWHQTGGTTLLGDANGDFLTFCVEINQDVHLGGTYSFYTGTVQSAPTPGNPIPGSSGMGATKAALLDELWDRHYADITDANSGAAFQVAVWDIVYDADFNLNSGNFKAYGNTAATTLAATWLTDINTNNTPYGNPNLIAIKSDCYQDQVTFGPPVLSPPPGTPLPSAASGTAVALLGLGLGRLTGRRRSPR
jgi:hypothetical protein